MSISGALSNALSGLTASARAAQVVSSNIANASTDGYGRRTLSQSAQAYGDSGGVTVHGVARNVNPVALSERRLADAGLALASGTNSFHNRMEALVGNPSDASSLSGVLASFESSLATAAGSPDSDIRLHNVSQDAQTIVDTFKAASDGIKAMRGEADGQISNMVERLNGLLEQTEEFNRQISAAINMGQETAGLEDARQIAVDEIAELVPIKIANRDRGAVAIYTTSGSVLLDGSAAEVEFTGVGTVMPHMTVDNGMLSGITINGYPMRVDSEKGALAGGAIGAQFAIRDELSVQAQAQLDGAARSLVERFQDPAMDPTLGVGDAGIFTDSGLAFNAADEVGLAGRLDLNNLVALDGAGETWRLRDGLGAVAPGDVGDATQLNALLDAMQAQVVSSSPALSLGASSMSELGADFHSSISSARVQSDKDVAFAAASQSSLEALMLAEGVDTDAEMQKLMLIEQAYAANARLIQAVDEMMDALMRL